MAARPCGAVPRGRSYDIEPLRYHRIGMRPALIPLFGALLACAPALAHEGPDARLTTLTRQLAAGDGRDVALLFQRACLLRREGSWHAALRDLTLVRRLEPGHEGWELEVARVFLGLRMYEAASERLDALIESRPTELEPRRERARLHQARHAHEAAARDLSLVVERGADSHRPDDVFSLVQSLRHCHDGPARALHVLDGILTPDAGAARPIAYVLLALELERELGRFDAALARIDELREGPGRAEQWLALRGEVLLQAGHPDEAAHELRAALSALDARKPSLRRKPSTLQLERKLQHLLATVSSEDS